MAEKLPMLALSPTMEEGVIAQWLKKEGDSIEDGEVVCEVETDKATMDYTAMVEGVLLKILVEEGNGAKVGEPIAIVGEAGEELDESAFEVPEPPAKPAPEPEKATEPEAEAVEAKVPAAPPPARGTRIRATPAARGLAAENGIDLKELSGTGPNGRVVKADIEAAIKQGLGKTTSGTATALGGDIGIVPIGQEDDIVPLSNSRRVIAQRLAASKFSAPHYYLKLSAEMDELLDVRSRLNAMRDGRLSFNAFLIKLVAQALKRNLTINSSWNTDNIIQHNRVDIALAVAVDGGLITPVVRNCGAKSIADIDEELKVLIAKAKEGKLLPEEYSDPTFTISNLGSFGIEEFTAIINPPGSAILAVGKTTRQAVVDNDQISIKSIMKLTLSCDHRVIDGAVGAKFMSDLRLMLEAPSLALA